MSSAPFFSVMIPTYNQAHFLDQCFASLVAQTDPDWEAVVVDDGSTDDTPETLAAWMKREPRIRSIRQKNGGTAAALNTALENSRGQWVCWLSSDDLFEPDKLAVHREAMATHPDIRFFHTHFSHLDGVTGNVSEPDHWRPIPPAGLQVARFLSGNYVCGITICVQRDAMLEVGGFRTDLRHGQDFSFWLSLSRLQRSHFIDRRTASLRWHEEQTTNAFPERGFYDSAWACLEFLNAHPFAELFPALDLDVAEQAEAAVNEALTITMDTRSFLHQLGYCDALLARLLEWATAPEGGAGRERGRALLREAADSASRIAAPPAIQHMFVFDLHRTNEYRPTPPLDFIRRTIADPQASSRKRRNLERYLELKRREAEHA